MEHITETIHILKLTDSEMAKLVYASLLITKLFDKTFDYINENNFFII